jgi:hypothetical protein
MTSRKLLKQIEPAVPAIDVGEPESTSKPTVYLAECSYDRRLERERFAADLKLHGYTVLPKCELPRDEVSYVAEVSNAGALRSFGPSHR